MGKHRTAFKSRWYSFVFLKFSEGNQIILILQDLTHAVSLEYIDLCIVLVHINTKVKVIFCPHF